MPSKKNRSSFIRRKPSEPRNNPGKMTEKGHILTQFEEVYGKHLEHEVIKTILQSVQWNTKTALEAFSSMVDEASLSVAAKAKIAKLASLTVCSNGPQENLEFAIIPDAEATSLLHNPTPPSVPHNSPSVLPKINSSQDYRNCQADKRNSANDSSVGAEAMGRTSPTEWPQTKTFKANNNNVNCKVTNLSRNPTFTNEHRTYDKFLSDATQLKKGLPVSEANKSNHMVAMSVTEKPTCMMQLIEVMLSNGTEILVIMRGLPGSGKSTLARKITNGRGIILSADDFFVTASGHYAYNPDQISEAHEWAQRKARDAIRRHVNPVVIDNTNLQKWEMRPYVLMALEMNYKVEFLEPDTSWRYNSRELARRTRHNVPREKIESMMDRFERNVKLKDFDIPAKFLNNVNCNFTNKVSNTTNGVAFSHLQKGYNVPSFTPGRSNFSVPCSLPIVAKIHQSSVLAPPDSSNSIPSTSRAPLPYSSTSPPSASTLSIDSSTVLHEFSPSPRVSPSAPPESPRAPLATSTASPIPSTEHVDSCSSPPHSAPLLLSDSVPHGLTLPSSAKIFDKEASSTAHIALASLISTAASVSTATSISTAVPIPTGVPISSAASISTAAPILTAATISAADNIPTAAPISEFSVKAIVNAYKESLESDYLVPSREASPVIFDSDEFEDIVDSLDVEVGKQIQKTGETSRPPPVEDEQNDSATEDAKMYQLCEDLEDKLGDTISSLIRPTLVRATEDYHNDNAFDGESSLLPGLDTPTRKSIKVPDLDTVTEEITQDLSKLNTREDDATGCVSDATSNDASSVELVKEDDALEKVHEDEWDCVRDSSKVSWDEETEGKLPSFEAPLEARAVTRVRKHQSNDDDLVEVIDLKKPSNEPVVDDGWNASPDVNSWNDDTDYNFQITAMRQTGAVPKRSREPKKDTPCRPHASDSSFGSIIHNNLVEHLEKSSQTDFNITLGVNSLTVLFGNARGFVSSGPPDVTVEGPMTRGSLRLDKGTMTDELQVQDVKAEVQHLKCFFPSIPDDSLEDILEKCNNDVDWAMNVLLDGGYKIAGDGGELIDYSFPDSGKSSCSNSLMSSSSELPSRSSSPNRIKKKTRRRKNKAKRQPCEEFPSLSRSPLLKLQTKDSELRSTSSSPALGKSASPSNSDGVSNSAENSVSVDDYKNFDKVSLELDSLFAHQLVNIFGPVGNLDLNHSFTAGERRIYLPLRLCKEIHEVWNQTMSKDLGQQDSRTHQLHISDAAYAMQLQMEEDNHKTNRDGSGSSGSPPSFFEGFGCSEPPTSLREIMDLEKAFQRSVKKDPMNSMALRLSERRLCSEFTHVDANVVKDTLMECKGKYEDAMAILVANFGAAPVGGQKPVTEMAEAVRDTEEMALLEQQLRQDMDSGSSIIENTKGMWGEYELYQSLRKTTLEKASLVTGPNAPLIKSHYMQQAAQFALKMKAAEDETNMKVLQQRNLGRDPNTLDLHVLTVPASLLACERFLQERLQALQTYADAGGPRKMTLTFITGWGRHSQQGKSKIRPAVRNLLEKKGYRIRTEEKNPGVITCIISL